MSRTLSAPVTVAFDYTRSTGPVLGRFLTGLRDQRVVGGRTSEGRVVVPPPEFDPVTHRQLDDLVEVADTGTVTSWTWVPEPVAGQPLDRPFAFVLVTLDGADAPLVHALDVTSPDQVRTGMRVRIRWAPERVGAITDIACFEPVVELDEVEIGAGGPDRARPQPRDEAATEQSRSGDGPAAVTTVITPVELDYLYAASPEESAFYRALAEGRIIGQRCPTCGKVYVPPRSACPADGTPTTDEVELSQTGTVTTFCVVNVPFLGQRIKPPYVSAYVLLDGADIAFLHLILDIPAEEVRMGMRVEAVWKPREEWGTTIENISHFRPTGEPDADFDTYKQHL
ncbi:Zn-ribbon domain-containing OB-fold protein [Nocardioides marmotae]|uniref:Zn-ribbon domain-containing OB-fold protein n=1 Tax=Nocardioides marmotae TaxID=2663857 RepID=UPI0012B5BC89|nr:OB-fold nucleic acid binding domain-containing protein [Nocardioides marmotae]MBC9731766.1 OB-fold domain-containing protein [Nocardioides marmotae]MTB82888.1 DNA-binding protein [Nocardioides marmotae]